MQRCIHRIMLFKGSQKVWQFYSFMDPTSDCRMLHAEDQKCGNYRLGKFAAVRPDFLKFCVEAPMHCMGFGMAKCQVLWDAHHLGSFGTFGTEPC